MSWTYAGIKRNALGVVLIVGMFALMVPSALNSWTNDASPIRSVETVDTMVRSVQFDRVDVYLVSLKDGSSVLIRDNRSHLIGGPAKIERVTRDNGSIFYRFPE